MSKVSDYCIDLLVNTMGVGASDAPNHPFTIFCKGLERKSNHARLVYPVIYLVIGVILGLLLCQFDPHTSDRGWKLFGAALGVFSALLVFWKPAVELEQADCMRLLGGRRLTFADLMAINKMLSLPTKTFDNVLKLVGTVSSFLAIYLLTGGK